MGGWGTVKTPGSGSLSLSLGVPVGVGGVPAAGGAGTGTFATDEIQERRRKEEVGSSVRLSLDCLLQLIVSSRRIL